MRLVALALTLVGGHLLLRASASNLRTPGDLQKLQTIEHSLQGLAKQAHAPVGTDNLLKTITKAEADLKVAGAAADAQEAVMKRVNTAMAAFKEGLVSRQHELKKDAAADEAKKVNSLSDIAKKLQARLDRLNTAEKDMKERAKERADSEAKLKAIHKKRQSKDDIKTEKLLTYLAKKNKREIKKKLASWSVERKALTEAIRSAKSGDAEATRKAMEQVMHAEKGDQDFLH